MLRSDRGGAGTGAGCCDDDDDEEAGGFGGYTGVTVAGCSFGGGAEGPWGRTRADLRCDDDEWAWGTWYVISGATRLDCGRPRAVAVDAGAVRTLDVVLFAGVLLAGLLLFLTGLFFAGLFFAAIACWGDGLAAAALFAPVVIPPAAAVVVV